MTFAETQPGAARAEEGFVAEPPGDAGWEACIEALYDAVGHAGRLAGALGAFRACFDAQGVMFLTIPDARFPTTSHTGVVGVPDQCLLEYHSHFNAHDEWALAAVRRADFGTGAIYRGADLIPRQALDRSYFGRHFVRRYGIQDILTSVVEISNSAGPTTFVTFHRQVGLPPFEPGDAHRLARLLPHLRRVLRLHRQLAPSLALGQTLQQVVQRMEAPVLFLDRKGRLVDGNAAARQWLACAASPLQLRAGRVAVCHDGRWRDLAVDLASLAAHASPRLELPLGGASKTTTTLALHALAPGGDGFAHHESFAVATLLPRRSDAAASLRERFGLTGSEARIALQLAQGQRASEIASGASVALSTVRTHIRSILDKCGVRSQVQLVALVLGEPEGGAAGG